MHGSNRRDFLRTGGAALAGAALVGVGNAQVDPRGGVAHQKTLQHSEIMRRMFPGAHDKAEGRWTLPPLTYPYDSLEPHIDGQTMRLHHDKHHQGYVNGLNNAEAKLKEMRESGDYSMIEHWSNEASFHGAGHFLHTVFWDSMNPQGGGDPDGLLAAQLQLDFGSVQTFKGQFSAAALKVQGSGWAVLSYQMAGGGLTVLQARNHQMLSQWGLVPLLCLDVWEHAYYLTYQNRRADYIKAFWNVVNWKSVGIRLGYLMGQLPPSPGPMLQTP